MSPCANCSKEASLKCSKCNNVCYCNVACQKQHWKLHKGYCCASMGDSLCQTVKHAFINAQNNESVPQLTQVNDKIQLSLVFAGARDETTMNFKYWFELLRNSVYPDINSLKILFVGPELHGFGNSNQIISKTPEISVSYRQCKFEEAFKTPLDISSKHHAVIVMNPGMSAYLDSWTPSFELIFNSEVLVVTTGYSLLNHWTHDALFDEPIYREYFGANIITTTTRNPYYFAAGNKAKNAFFIIMKGKNDAVAILNRTEILTQMQYIFLEYIAYEAINYENAEEYGRYCLKVLSELKAGNRTQLAAQMSHGELENMVQSEYYSSSRTNVKKY